MAKAKKQVINESIEAEEHENVTETIEVEKKPFKTLAKPINVVSAAQYWDFEAEPYFMGQYVGEQRADITDPKTKEVEHNKLIGYVFQDDSGEQHIIGNSHSIEKAMNYEIDGVPAYELYPVMQFEFLGKVEVKGKPFNRFKIDILGY